MGRRAVGTGAVQEVRLSSMPMPRDDCDRKTMSHLREDTLRMSGRGVPVLRPKPLCMQEKGKSEARRRQRACYPAHDVHDLLAPRRHTDLRKAVHGVIVRQTAGVL